MNLIGILNPHARRRWRRRHSSRSYLTSHRIELNDKDDDTKNTLTDRAP